MAVIVVEDHDDSREMIVLALEAFGAQVVSMNSAAEALASLQTVRPDVLVSDLSMPDMDRFQLLHALRASPALRDLPAIAVSSHWHLSEKATQSGFQRFMRKPIDVMELCRAIARVTGREADPI